MKTKMSTAILVMLFLLTLVILFHLLILVHVIPYEITWGGRLQNDNEMYIFETISILINLFLGWILLMKAQLVTYKFRPGIVNFLLWLFLGMFLINTIGNIFAATTLERFFSILTLLFAVLIWRILRGNIDKKNQYEMEKGN